MSECAIFIRWHVRGWVWDIIKADHSLMREGSVASGYTPDYDEACRMAKIAWEQHSEDEGK